MQQEFSKNVRNSGAKRPSHKGRCTVTLRELPTHPSFNMSTDEVARQFLVPALSRAQRYDRGVGFFSSAWLRVVASGLVALAKNGGSARIVASPKLSAEDWAGRVRSLTLICADMRTRYPDRPIGGPSPAAAQDQRFPNFLHSVRAI